MGRNNSRDQKGWNHASKESGYRGVVLALALGGGAIASAAASTTVPTGTSTAPTGTSTAPPSASGWFSYTPVAGAQTSPSTTDTADGAEPSAAPPGAYNIFTTFNCQCFNGQKTIVDRVGYYDAANDAGFGRAKHLEKHNMYVHVVGVIVAGPNHSSAGGSSGQAYAYADRDVNGGVQQIKIYAVYDTRILSDKRSFGIVTGYCVGYTKCPQWVNEIP